MELNWFIVYLQILGYNKCRINNIIYPNISTLIYKTFSIENNDKLI